ncbi:DUF5993 family protein [Halioglobus pacificus]|uniref:DUF5993 family protein n=1 Tax=Parahalioglobus pacificus TaxID=930806 RepID=UPI003570DEB7
MMSLLFLLFLLAGLLVIFSPRPSLGLVMGYLSLMIMLLWLRYHASDTLSILL